MLQTFGIYDSLKSKKLFIISVFCACLFSAAYAQERDTIITLNKTILCQIYALDGGHIRYREKGVGKIISCGDIINCSTYWKHKVDSVNGTGSAKPNMVDITKFSDSIKYCELIGYEFKKMAATIITIDYGQKQRKQSMLLNALLPGYEDIKMSDVIISKNGRVVFNTMIDALNFMVLNGWEFVTCYVSQQELGNVYHYLLHRK
ncbi:MAG TPA: hypothetical protein VNZ45_02695 [Bacteroidia bacterium]|jgi:hypothetical protein|nr:hypothetical protein [Bacteroidia bacterium]